MSTVIRTVWGEGFFFLRIIHDETMTMPQKRSVVLERNYIRHRLLSSPAQKADPGNEWREGEEGESVIVMEKGRRRGWRRRGRRGAVERGRDARGERKRGRKRLKERLDEASLFSVVRPDTCMSLMYVVFSYGT